MARLKVPLSHEDHVQGSPDASVVLVEYGDFECPHCRAAHFIVKGVQQYFGQDLIFCYRHFPLLDIHPNALPAAEAAEWAGSQNRFWEMHDLIFENQEQLSPITLLELAERINLGPEGLASGLEEGQFRESGAASGVHGTPTFFINGEQHVGSYEFKDLVDAIEQQRFLRAS
jgi:protein-disulfide isomerase